MFCWCSWSMTLSYSGWLAVSTRRGWLHSLRRYWRAWGRVKSQVSWWPEYQRFKSKRGGERRGGKTRNAYQRFSLPPLFPSLKKALCSGWRVDYIDAKESIEGTCTTYKYFEVKRIDFCKHTLKCSTFWAQLARTYRSLQAIVETFNLPCFNFWQKQQGRKGENWERGREITNKCNEIKERKTNLEDVWCIFGSFFLIFVIIDVWYRFFQTSLHLGLGKVLI